MALKIRRRKKSEYRNQHPSYLMGKEANTVEDEREEKMPFIRRRFWFVIGICALILIILIVSIVASMTNIVSAGNEITASDTFAVSSMEQEQMASSAETFATGMMLFSYCTDDRVAENGKRAALATMATNTSSYSEISALSRESGSGVLGSDKIQIVVGEPIMNNGSRSFAGRYNYSIDALAVDKTTVSDTNRNGTAVDAGYHITLTFASIEGQNGDTLWVVSDCEISEK